MGRGGPEIGKIPSRLARGTFPVEQRRREPQWYQAESSAVPRASGMPITKWDRAHFSTAISASLTPLLVTSVLYGTPDRRRNPPRILNRRVLHTWGFEPVRSSITFYLLTLLRVSLPRRFTTPFSVKIPKINDTMTMSRKKLT